MVSIDRSASMSLPEERNVNLSYAYLCLQKPLQGVKIDLLSFMNLIIQYCELTTQAFDEHSLMFLGF